MELVNDLIEVISYYTTPDVTLDLLLLDRTLVNKVYAGRLWRRKLEVIRRGLVSSDETSWYHAYRIYNVNDYGEVNGIGATGVNGYDNNQYRIYDGTENYLFNGVLPIRTLTGPRIVRSVSVARQPIELVACLDERGRLYLLTGYYGLVELDDEVIDITPSSGNNVNVLMRGGTIIVLNTVNYIYNKMDPSNLKILRRQVTSFLFPAMYATRVLSNGTPILTLNEDGTIITRTGRLSGRWCNMGIGSTADTVYLLGVDGKLVVYNIRSNGTSTIQTNVKRCAFYKSVRGWEYLVLR